MAKMDKLGNLITAPEALKNLYLQAYVENVEKSRLIISVIIRRK